MISLEWYRTFKCIYECGSLTLASQKLFMSQPGVSKQLSALEADIGKILFERTPRKLLPTEYGKFLYSQIIGYVEGLESAEKKFRRGSNKNCPSIVVGCSYDFFKQGWIDKIAWFNMYITFKFGKRDELAEMLEKGQIHLLVSEEKYADYNHDFSLLTEGKLKLIVSAKMTDIPFTQLNSKNAKEIQKWLSSQLWYAYDNDLTFIKDFWKENFNTRPQIMAKYVFPSFKDIVHVLEKSKGLTI
ncbi:MAG: LysR family transcriptional regulator, partial [Bacteroidia bacterium]